jgi:y4mF family transcriptional regulator
MQVRSVRDIGAAIRGRRQALGWTQAHLAGAAETTRQWVIAIERGKPGAEIAPVLRTLAALGLVADLVEAPVPHGAIDLDTLLDGERGD